MAQEAAGRQGISVSDGSENALVAPSSIITFIAAVSARSFEQEFTGSTQR